MTGLYAGERLSKTDIIFEALGSTDELSSHLGLALCHLQGTPVPSLPPQLIAIQATLQDLNSHLATPREQASPLKAAKTAFNGDARLLEQWIDAMDAHLTPLTRFILPSGGLVACQLHVARTVCRRAERRVQAVLALQSQLDPQVGVYLNRLSDYLFTAARYACQQTGGQELFK